MRLPTAIGAASVAIAVFAGGFAIGHFATDDSGSSKTKASGKPQVLGQVFARNGDTSTTTAPPVTLAPASPSTTQAPSNQPSAGAQGATQGATTQQTAVATSPPQTTPPTVVVSGDCGSGTAFASVASKTFPQHETANTDYETDVTATVNDQVNKPIQIDSLAVRLTYEDGGVQDLVFNQAQGVVVQPGNTANFSVALNTGQRQVKNQNDGGVVLQSFSFHTEGHPECTGRPA